MRSPEITISWRALIRIDHRLVGGVRDGEISSPCDTNRADKGYLKLDGYQSEVDDLYQRPNDVIGLERRHVDILKLANDCSLSTSFGDRHECEEACQTYRIY
jgi:hypothetical protein